jgi:hypothetical protein
LEDAWRTVVVVVVVVATAAAGKFWLDVLATHDDDI